MKFIISTQHEQDEQFLDEKHFKMYAKYKFIGFR